VSFPNSTTRTHRLCLRPDQTHGQNPYVSRLNRQVYDQTKSADLSETRADPIGLCRRRPGSPTKSGRARLVEFGHYPAPVVFHHNPSISVFCRAYSIIRHLTKFISMTNLWQRIYNVVTDKTHSHISNCCNTDARFLKHVIPRISSYPGTRNSSVSATPNLGLSSE